jgi:hypothetical protein
MTTTSQKGFAFLLRELTCLNVSIKGTARIEVVATEVRSLREAV